MKASRFNETQIISILQESEARTVTIEVLCRKHVIAEATVYRWRT